MIFSISLLDIFKISLFLDGVVVSIAVKDLCRMNSAVKLFVPEQYAASKDETNLWMGMTDEYLLYDNSYM